MADSQPGAAQSDRVREIEMRLFEEIGAQLKGVSDAMRDLTREMRDVRERLIRIEAQDQPQKIAQLESDLRVAHDEIVRIEREAADALTAAIATGVADRNRMERDFTDIKSKLEQRLQRMEIIIAPLTVGGSAFLAAVIGALVTMLQGHMH